MTLTPEELHPSDDLPSSSAMHSMRACGETRDGRRLRGRNLHSCRRVQAELSAIAEIQQPAAAW
jgi:hypothetical protein